MDTLDKFLGYSTMTIVSAMQKIDENSRGVLFILDAGKRLTGSLTDGDIRRWLIKTGQLETDVSKVMFGNPRYIYEGHLAEAATLMKEYELTALPVVNEKHEVVDILFDKGVLDRRRKAVDDALKETPVIIMAGGRGTRLYPYTQILPKPLIPIGDTPIIERIINRFCRYGAQEYYITVNYRKSMIKSYFSELSPCYKIHYVEEGKPLGTAGSIRLIDQKFSSAVFVTNCDILIEADYGKILSYHNENGNAVTIVAALKNVVVPYGVLDFKENGLVTDIREKPKLSYFVNTGVYVISPQYFHYIPENVRFDMPELLNLLMQEGKKVGVYPLSEDAFMDMGELEELKKMEEKLNRQK